jgi:hypothetical protein
LPRALKLLVLLIHPKYWGLPVERETCVMWMTVWDKFSQKKMGVCQAFTQFQNSKELKKITFWVSERRLLILKLFEWFPNSNCSLQEMALTRAKWKVSRKKANKASYIHESFTAVYNKVSISNPFLCFKMMPLSLSFYSASCYHFRFFLPKCEDVGCIHCKTIWLQRMEFMFNI